MSGTGDRDGALICIGASTGGISALETVLRAFPADCPPTLVVQHILPGFAQRFCERLDRLCAARIRDADEGAALERGVVRVATGCERHLVVDETARRCALKDASPVSGHRPSVDVLFQSAARCRRPVVAAILTGMGSDGAKGMWAIRQAGGRTIAQDEHTSTVYGMPRAALDAGGVEFVLPLSEISRNLLALAASSACRRAG